MIGDRAAKVLRAERNSLVLILVITSRFNWLKRNTSSSLFTRHRHRPCNVSLLRDPGPLVYTWLAKLYRLEKEKKKERPSNGSCKQKRSTRDFQVCKLQIIIRASCVFTILLEIRGLGINRQKHVRWNTQGKRWGGEGRGILRFIIVTGRHGDFFWVGNYLVDFL